MKIIHVPIERVPNRYTSDWVDQFEREFTQSGVEFVTIGGNPCIPINTGSVLDCFGTNRYKFIQLNILIGMIENGDITQDDVILFADAWFPGLESLFYIRQITGIDFKIAGILHAGTWDPFDFTSRNGMRNWAQHTELGWLHGLDIIFVATQWHKDLIVMNSGDFDETKIFVTGIPFYAKGLREKYLPEIDIVKENIVVFPHRLDAEKQPEKFDRLAKKYPQWRFVKTIEATPSRDDYFKLLAKSKVMVSFARQETFGYSTVEAMALGNFVIVPNELSYRETVRDNFMRYTNERAIPEMLETFMANSFLPEYENTLDDWAQSVPRMIRVLGVKMREAERRRKDLEQFVADEQIRIEKERQARKSQRNAQREETKVDSE